MRRGTGTSNLPLTASEVEHVVTLDPELVISGTVTDATTGQPVPRFRLIRGQEQLEGRQGLWWSHKNDLEYTGGRYSIKFDFPMKAQYVRIEAYGYEPADSRAFRSDEGAQVQDLTSPDRKMYLPHPLHGLNSHTPVYRVEIRSATVGPVSRARSTSLSLRRRQSKFPSWPLLLYNSEGERQPVASIAAACPCGTAAPRACVPRDPVRTEDA